MPNNYDFSNLNDLKEIIVNPKGWINPLIVEYGVGSYGEILSYFWRVKGTKHTFIIPIIRIDYLTEGNYKIHFEEALESFREEYLGWKFENFYTLWMKEYKDIFEKLIIIEE